MPGAAFTGILGWGVCVWVRVWVGPDWPLGMGGRSCPQRLVLMVSLEKDLECQFLLAPITSDLKGFHRTASVLCLRKSP